MVPLTYSAGFGVDMVRNGEESELVAALVPCPRPAPDPDERAAEVVGEEVSSAASETPDGAMGPAFESLAIWISRAVN